MTEFERCKHLTKYYNLCLLQLVNPYGSSVGQQGKHICHTAKKELNSEWKIMNVQLFKEKLLRELRVSSQILSCCAWI